MIYASLINWIQMYFYAFDKRKQKKSKFKNELIVTKL